MKNIQSGESQFHAVDEKKRDASAISQGEILAQFSEKQQEEIKYKQKVLSSLAYFIGKDFEIPVELNQPGGGWHWNFKDNKIGIDPKDLLEKPLDYLRFVISHEGGHRRISRTEFIPQEIWNKPGFSFMTNAIEDPRSNNFVAENYPKFREQMKIGYEWLSELESKTDLEAKNKLGCVPRFKRAGYEYIKLWFQEQAGEKINISQEIPLEVHDVVQKTLASAQESWWRYPSKKEADESEDVIKKYAEVSYKINLEEIWPEFQKLVEEDINDQKMQEALKDMQQGQNESEAQEQSLPQELVDKLTPEQQKELEKAMEEAMEKNKKEPEQGDAGQASETGEESLQESENGSPVDLDSFSDELKQKIKEYIDSFSDDKKKELQERAEKKIQEMEKTLNEELKGKLSENPEKKITDKKEEKEAVQESEKENKQQSQSNVDKELEEQRQKDLKKYRDLLEKSLEKDANTYEKYRKDVLPIIDSLENDLREIFVARRASRWQSGFKTGKRIDIKTRIQEKAKGVSAVESKAWQKRELPTEKDYAISILVDLSGSMSGEKIQETFKALIVLSEVLNKLSIKTEILGFNDRLYEYQIFGENISREIRENMGGVLKEVDNHSGGRADYNDDGWALSETSKRLAKQKANEKFIMVLSDGQPVESSQHSGSEFDLSRVVNHIMQESDQKLLGLGIGSGTQHVEKYYPNSLANIDIKEMAEKLADTIKEMIVNYQNF